MGYIRQDEKEKLLCVFNAADYTIKFKVPEEFIGGKTYMGTDLVIDELTIPRDGCAFVRIERKPEPVVSEKEDEKTEETAAEEEDELPELHVTD